MKGFLLALMRLNYLCSLSKTWFFASRELGKKTPNSFIILYQYYCLTKLFLRNVINVIFLLD